MNKKAALITMVVFFGLAIFSVNVPAVRAETKLTYSCFFPPTHIQSKLAEEWAKEVGKRTDGQVKVEYYPGQTLTKAQQCYDGVVEGLSDIGLSCLSYTRGRFPVMAAVDLPMGYTSGLMATNVANDVLKKFNPKEFHDVNVMYLHAHGPGLVHTRGKPVHAMADMKGLKFRATGTSALVVSALGGMPVPKPMPENYEMLQKGVVDGSMHPFESNKGWRLGEVLDYATGSFSTAYTTTFFVVMNKDKWASLPGNVQAIIEQINAEWALKHAEAWDTSDMEGIKYFLDQGGQIVGLKANEQAACKKAVEPILSDYVKDAKAKGIENAHEIVDFIAQQVTAK
ncbi:MAG: TRAP transporter substrate-binding protein [Desulfobacterales bacterium]|jgi:TRAP-type C4-dicarboxylate transport system substrate-binding protein|nr:TRAP transporter substrate-binding protein [Desulfobacterales bacterium]